MIFRREWLGLLPGFLTLGKQSAGNIDMLRRRKILLSERGNIFDRPQVGQPDVFGVFLQDRVTRATLGELTQFLERLLWVGPGAIHLIAHIAKGGKELIPIRFLALGIFLS